MINHLAAALVWFLNLNRSLSVLISFFNREITAMLFSQRLKEKIFDQKSANRLSLAENILFVAGHYKEIDDRVREKFATDEISVGNFALTGGELPALIIVDAVVRLIPGVLNDSESALDDSFQDGEKIEAPFYTRPAVPGNESSGCVELSGNEKEIKKWKEEQSNTLTEKWRNYNNLWRIQ